MNNIIFVIFSEKIFTQENINIDRIDEQFQIALQILINKGYKILVAADGERAFNYYKNFVHIFYDENIKIIDSIINEDKYKFIEKNDYLICFSNEDVGLAKLLNKNFVFVDIDSKNTDEKDKTKEKFNKFTIENLNAGKIVKIIEEYMYNAKQLEDKDIIEEKNINNEDNDNKLNESSEFENYKIQVKKTIEQLINSNNLDEAKNLIKEYESIVKDDVDICSFNAILNIFENDLEEAIKILNDGLLRESTNFDLLYNMAYVYSLLKDNEKATIFYIRALKNCIDDGIHNKIIETLQNDYGIQPSDIYKIENGINTDLNQSELEVYKEKVKENIKLLVSKGNLQVAKQLINEYQDIVKDDMELYSIETVILIKENNFPKAIKVAKQGLDIDKDNFDLLFNIAYIYEMDGQLNLALEYYKKAFVVSNSENLKQQIHDILVELQEKINKKLTKVQQQRSAEFQKRIQNVKYASKQKLVKVGSKNYIHIVYALTHVGVCGGVKIILEHANYLKQLGAKVTLISHFPKPIWFPINVDYIEVPFEMELAEEIPECDVIVATYWDHIQACIDVNKAPVVYFEQGDFHLYDTEKVEHEIMDFIKIQFTLPQFIITVSNQTAKVIKNVYRRNSTVFHNSVNERVFTEKGIVYKLDKPYILMMGSDQTKFKGTDDILAAYNLLKQRGYKLNLIWITPTNPLKDYKDITKVFVSPSQQTIAELYRGAFLYVSGSYYESFPLPGLEAMSCGCPVITTDNIGVKEYAKDRYNALFAKISNITDLAEKMIECISNKYLRDKLVSNGLRTAENFKWKTIMPKILDYYKFVAKYKVVEKNSRHKAYENKVIDPRSNQKLSEPSNLSINDAWKPKISVIMPVYNVENFIRLSIESILNQTEENFELIIVNDGSTDRSEEIILSFNDSRINYIRQKNSGVSAARNLALRNAKGSYIVFQDADDISLPNRFTTLLSKFDSTDIGIVHSDVLLINEVSQPIGYWTAYNLNKDSISKFFLKVGTPFNNPSIMIRSEALINELFDTSLDVGEDTDIVYRISKKCKTIHVSEPLYLYRRHSSNATKILEYEKVAMQVRKFLNSCDIKLLFPEIDWKNEDTNNNSAKAFSLIGLYLYRRGMIPDAQIWFNKSSNLTIDNQTVSFVNAIGNIITGNYNYALSLLESIYLRDHIIENYIGEVKALLGNFNQAYMNFIKSLELNPSYDEPMENLKAIGKNIEAHNLDVTWKKFQRN